MSLALLSDTELDAVTGGWGRSTENTTVIKNSIVAIGNTVAVDDSRAYGGIVNSVVIVGSGNTVGD